MAKKEAPKQAPKKADDDGSLLIPILTAALVCVGLFTAAVIGMGVWYVSTADQRAVTPPPSQSDDPVRSMPSSLMQGESPEPAQEPENTPSQQPEESNTPEQSTPPQESISQSPAVEPSETPSATTSQSQATPAASQPQTGGATVSNGDGTYTHDFSGGRVLITNKSNNGGNPVYHTKDCQAARKIPPENEDWYSSAQKAIDDGRDLCGYCAKG